MCDCYTQTIKFHMSSDYHLAVRYTKPRSDFSDVTLSPEDKYEIKRRHYKNPSDFKNTCTRAHKGI